MCLDGVSNVTDVMIFQNILQCLCLHYVTVYWSQSGSCWQHRNMMWDLLFPLCEERAEVRCEASYCLNMMKRGCSQAVNKMLLIRLYPAENYLTEGATNRAQRLFTETFVCVCTCVRCAHLSVQVCQGYFSHSVSYCSSLGYKTV